eukprot:3090102-Rhodomonas_salina.2
MPARVEACRISPPGWQPPGLSRWHPGHRTPSHRDARLWLGQREERSRRKAWAAVSPGPGS